MEIEIKDNSRTNDHSVCVQVWCLVGFMFFSSNLLHLNRLRLFLLFSAQQRSSTWLPSSSLPWLFSLSSSLELDSSFIRRRAVRDQNRNSVFFHHFDFKLWEDAFIAKLNIFLHNKIFYYSSKHFKAHSHSFITVWLYYSVEEKIRRCKERSLAF